MGETKQPQLNGAYYGPSIPPPSKAYHHPGRGGGGCCCNPFSCCCSCIMNCICTCICQIIFTIIIIVGIIALVLWLIFRPNTVKFHVTDASLPEFNLTNNMLHYNLALNLTIRNPNKRIGIYYDRIEARAFYQGQRFQSVELPTFYQGHKNTTNLTAVFKGQNIVPLGNKELSNYNSDRTSGMYDIDVKLYLRTRLKFSFVKSSRVKPKIECDLRIPLSSNGTAASGVYESTRTVMEPLEQRRAEGSRGNKTRRSWSDGEEAVLLRCLKEIVAEGWKSDNGFRAGYLNRLENMMVKAFPGTDLKAIPHINSKVHVWKKDYSSLISMVGKTGIGFCHGTNMIESTDEAWEHYKKVDANARLMRFKTWPMFKDWIEIFGKDRATGEGAEDMTDAANSIGLGCSPGDKGKAVLEEVTSTDEIENEADTASVFATSATPSDRSISGKKRKSIDEPQSIIEVLGKFLAASESRLSEIVSAFGFEKDARAARMELFKMMQGIVGLTPAEMMKASDLIVQNMERMDFFQSLPAESRADYVYYLLSLNI